MSGPDSVGGVEAHAASVGAEEIFFWQAGEFWSWASSEREAPRGAPETHRVGGLRSLARARRVTVLGRWPESTPVVTRSLAEELVTSPPSRRAYARRTGGHGGVHRYHPPTRQRGTLRCAAWRICEPSLTA